ncbi:MAG: ABC transporter permease [Nitrospinota bacterium]
MEWSSFLVLLLAAAVRLSTPVLLAALGEIFAERSGILNIGVEGMMLAGALGGVVGAYYAQNPWVGLLAGMAAAGLLALIHAFLSITVKADQIVSGVGINILALGLTAFFFRSQFGISPKPVMVKSFSDITVPVLGSIPFVGEILFQQNVLVYLALILVPLSWFVLARTNWGLNIRSVGERPQAADTAGINVASIRYFSTLVGGLLAGMGGCFLSLGQVKMFAEGMTAGRGFIALAAVIFGKWNPFGVLGAAVIFGVAEAVQLRLQAHGFEIAYQFLLMIPYVLTIVALAGLVGKSVYPEALGRPYSKGGE